MCRLLQINNLTVAFENTDGIQSRKLKGDWNESLKGNHEESIKGNSKSELKYIKIDNPKSTQKCTSNDRPEGELIAVNGVSLSLGAGETLALVGESGCGKTVLCKSMLKVLCSKGRIRQGEILLEGRNLVNVPESRMTGLRGGDIAMVFQDPMVSLDPAFSVGEQIAEVLRIHKKLSRSEARQQATELMEKVQIPDAAMRYNQRPYQFSGGMRQRIAIAIALAGEPKLLLADEPTTALDEETQKEILKLLKEIRRSTGAAILFITHDLSLVEDMAEHVAIMKDGVIVEQGDVKEVFACPQHPYTKKLLGYLDYKKGKGHNHKGHGAKTGSRSFNGEINNDVANNGAINSSATHKYEAFGKGVLQKADKIPEVNLNDTIRQCNSETDMADVVLTIKGLYKSFTVNKKTSNHVLKDFSMDICRGEIVGLVGQSGCGKSTLARCIMSIEKPDKGSIIIADSIAMQMIFQDSQSAFNDRMTVEEIIAEPLRIKEKYKKNIKRKDTDTCVGELKKQTSVMPVMKQVELDYDLADRKPYELSGGQRQRVAIARALITEPDLIIADEPLTGLDVSAQAQIVHLLRKLADEQGLTILFVAHDIPMVNHISNRIIEM